MEIKEITYRIGLIAMSNDEILDKIRFHSKDIHEGDLEETIAQVKFYLEKSGAKTRYWLKDDEHPIYMARDAINEGLEKLEWKKEEVDYIIHVGMFRGVGEPDQASHIAQALKMYQTLTFDVLKGCDSCVTGMHIAYRFLQSGASKKIIIVNTECTTADRPDCFCYKNKEDIKHKFPVCTNCDTVTATFLEINPDKIWDFNFSARNDLADKCAIPFPGYEKFCLPSKYMKGKPDNKLYSYMSILNKEGIKETKKLFQKSNIKIEEIDYVITHSHAKEPWIKVSEEVGLDLRKVINLYADYGNMISASLPISLAKKVEEGVIQRGHKILLWTASSGMGFSVTGFTY